ncbi:HIT domain-containing protein [Actinomycetospora endophytica]|uniref:HIT domain-containing protein n=1 Tax=Actinomycetospora endophytica TaxID=2291215 RepID=A0ABS8PF19_9PSEU|nr:HIT domain-containing protein [Actinomycetospora endophytica]MCD2196603.1 HIT domain-containing protein [Actinomycetospora endophytica]
MDDDAVTSEHAPDGAGARGLPAQPGRPESGVPLGHPDGAQQLDGAGTPDGFRRLWAPHRMAYIAGESGTGEVDGGCPLCAIPGRDDEDGLVVARGDLVYAVLNLHPYNPGHLMVVPYRHVAGLDEITDDESTELMRVTQQAIRALRAMSAPHGFNVGINLGHVAGGSLADHLHQHVVPRWGGDANFITVIGQTKVIPALLAETRQRLAEVWASTATGSGQGQ